MLRDLGLMLLIFLVLLAVFAAILALVAPGVLHAIFRGVCNVASGECS
jgi:hypothetical protein